VVLTASKVTVNKTVIPVPDGMEVEARYTPCLSRVEPYGTYEETVDLTTPLAPFTCYQGQLRTRNPVVRPL
jgi:hypothetical protein